MDIDSLYEQFEKPGVKFFIFDSKSDHIYYGDKDFEEYHWDKSKYNKVRPGDFFIYRRPQSASEIKNQFYLYGFGKIKAIEEEPTQDVSENKKKRRKPLIGRIELGNRFIDPILQSDLDDFTWTFKEKGPTWEYFFQQYGMNEINKKDFINLLKLGLLRDFPEEIFIDPVEQDFSAEDIIGNVKTRGHKHRKFAQQVKLNYQYQCAISGIKTKDFLVASHIKPWAEDKENRTNPLNGICLSSLLDKAFDKGYITIDANYKVQVSTKGISDFQLYSYLNLYNGERIKVPKQYQPDQEFLDWHRNYIFLDSKKTQ